MYASPSAHICSHSQTLHSCAGGVLPTPQPCATQMVLPFPLCQLFHSQMYNPYDLSHLAHYFQSCDNHQMHHVDPPHHQPSHCVPLHYSQHQLCPQSPLCPIPCQNRPATQHAPPSPPPPCAPPCPPPPPPPCAPPCPPPPPPPCAPPCHPAPPPPCAVLPTPHPQQVSCAPPYYPKPRPCPAPPCMPFHIPLIQPQPACMATCAPEYPVHQSAPPNPLYYRPCLITS